MLQMCQNFATCFFMANLPSLSLSLPLSWTMPEKKKNGQVWDVAINVASILQVSFSGKAAVFIFIFTFILNYAREEDKWAHMRCCRCIRILQIAFSGKAAVFIFIFTFILNDAREEVKMGTYEMLPKMLPQFCKFQFQAKLPSLGWCRRCRLHKIIAITAIANITGIAKIWIFSYASSSTLYHCE